MENQARFFRIPKHLDKGMMLCGFPVDEVGPALVLFSVFFFFFQSEIMGAGLACAWFFSLRILKQHHGAYCIPLFFYNLMPKSIVKMMFKRTPSTHKKNWIF